MTAPRNKDCRGKDCSATTSFLNRIPPEVSSSGDSVSCLQPNSLSSVRFRWRSKNPNSDFFAKNWPQSTRLMWTELLSQVSQSWLKLGKLEFEPFIHQSLGNDIATIESQFGIGTQDQWCSDADHPLKGRQANRHTDDFA